MIQESDIVVRVVDEIFDDILEWLDENEPDVDFIKEQLRRAFHGETDGYAIARALDNDDGWTPDARLVEILDDAFMHRAKAMRELAAKASS